jgi:hypothetical protein
MFAEPTLMPVTVAVPEVLPCGMVTVVGEILTAVLLLFRVTLTGPLWLTEGRLTVSVVVPPS